MNFTVMEKNHKTYIELASADTPIPSEQDVTDLVGACLENKTSLVMLHAEALSDDFLKLRTGLAGIVLQKLINYRIRAAAVITDEYKIQGKFKELLAESNRGRDFRVFSDKQTAEDWLLS